MGEHPGAINVGNAPGIIPGLEEHPEAVNVGDAPGVIPGLEEHPGAINVGDAPGAVNAGDAVGGDAPGVIPVMGEHPGANNVGNAPGVIPGLEEHPAAINVGDAPGAVNVGDAVGGGDGTGFDPYFLADYYLADFFLFHEDEHDPLIERRDPSGRLPEAELLAHQQAPALLPEPEVAPALPPEPEAAPALQPGSEAGPGLQPDPEAGPGLQPDPEAGPVPQPDPEEGPVPQPDPEEGPVPHAIATVFHNCRDVRLITSKILTPSDVDTTRSRLLLPSGDLHMLESATGQVLVVHDLEVRRFDISLREHRRGGSSTETGLVFTRGWSDLVRANGFQAGTLIQIWTFIQADDNTRIFLVVPV